MNRQPTVLPDPDRSLAVIVGVSRYRHLPTLPAVAANVTDLAEALTDPHVWGLPRRNCRMVHDPQRPYEVMEILHEAAETAQEALLVYFAGHGFTDKRGELRLALHDSDQQRDFSSIAYAEVRDLLVDTVRPHTSKIVILDCCYSGRAMTGSMAGPADIAHQAVINGSYLMTATAETVLALAPVGARHTAFTGALLDAIRNGCPDGPELLDLQALFTLVHDDLTSRGLPQPQERSRNAGHRVAIARNRALRPPGSGDEPIGATGALSSAGRWKTRLLSAIAAAVVLATTVTGIAIAFDGPRKPEGTRGIPQAGAQDPTRSTAAAIEVPTPSSSVDAYHEFILRMKGGFNYDIDIEPGESPEKNSGDDGGTPADADRDLYRSGGSGTLVTWQIYVSKPPTREVKRGMLAALARTAGPAECREQTTFTTAAISGDVAAVGDKACVLTGKGRRAFLTLQTLPKNPGDSVVIRVLLLR